MTLQPGKGNFSLVLAAGSADLAPRHDETAVTRGNDRLGKRGQPTPDDRLGEGGTRL